MSGIDLYNAGFADLISVLPPDAIIAPLSKIAPAMRGKVPGLPNRAGMWGGYKWQTAIHTLEEIEAFQGNVGLRAGRFPGVDIDVADPQIAQVIEDFALGFLGPAPVRIGNPPKRLLPYRTTEPFTRMRVTFSRGDARYLVEILGDGQQYIVEGIHPATRRPYQWSEDLAQIGAEGLTSITRDDAQAFMRALSDTLTGLGFERVKVAGDGLPRTEAGAQSGLLAPSLDALESAVAMIPNTDELFPDREAYLKLGYAIKAAGAEDEDRALAAFVAWAGRHTGSDRVEGNPETPMNDWRRMAGPYSVGWSYVAEQARAFGYNVAEVEFDAIETTETAAPDAPTQMLSDRWLEEKVVAARLGELRYVPELEKWLVWEGSHWAPDTSLRAEEVVKLELSQIAEQVSGWGGDAKEQAGYAAKAVAIEGATKARQVRELMQSNGSLALRQEMLDRDSMLLNTPAGTIDLRTGEQRPSNPNDLCTRVTSVAPKAGPHPRWARFLREATQGDTDLIGFLQRLCGYCLTGLTTEQQLTFIWGPGGNGKGVFVDVLTGVLKDYAVTAAMETFTTSSSERHTTELAMLAGARLVTASETENGKRWSEARVKQMTGGDKISARFMRQDNFTYRPQFKLVFLGNHKPEIRDPDPAWRRRLHLVPFTFTPPERDGELGQKLAEEYPAILGWMIEGCLAWQQQGLMPPEIVRATTDEYFAEEDLIGQWIAERCELHGTATLPDLYESWREWANGSGAFVGNTKRLHQALLARKLDRWTEETTNRPGFRGITVKPREDVLTAL